MPTPEMVAGEVTNWWGKGGSPLWEYLLIGTKWTDGWWCRNGSGEGLALFFGLELGVPRVARDDLF